MPSLSNDAEEPAMTARSPTPAIRPNAGFWLAAALIGAATAPLAGVIGAAMVVVLSAAKSGLAGTGAWIKPDSTAMLFSLGFTFALPLAPVTAACVPLAYRSARMRGRGARTAFIALAAFLGLVMPMLIGAAVSLALWNEGAVTIGALYGILGLGIAPICALLIWPLLRRMDERVTA
jgi:hypothetical protein